MVSVIIPNYNHASFLSQRIESVLNQTYQDFELIILDDCSTDNSRDVINKYKGHPKISHVVFNNTNSGNVFKQWKKGLEYAKGEFIWIAESDDYADNQFLNELVPLIRSKETIGIAYSDSNIVLNDGSHDSRTFAQYRKIWLSNTKWENSYINNGRAEISENLLQMCTINNASAVLFRKKALVQIDPFDLELYYTGDWYIYLKMCLQYDIAYCNRALNYYREHISNTSKASRNGITHVKEYFLIYNWVWNNIPFVSKKRIISLHNQQTRHSLSKNWRIGKLSLYTKLFRINKTLFVLMIGYNIIQPLRERIKKSHAIGIGNHP